MKHCKDCAHFFGTVLCRAPENGESPLDGKPRAMFATERRSPPGEYIGSDRCGPDAKHFAPKLPPKRPWWSTLIHIKRAVQSNAKVTGATFTGESKSDEH